MKPVLLLGPDHDACLSSFAEYARALHCPCAYMTDFTDIRFAIKDETDVRPHSKSQVILKVPSLGDEEWNSSGILIRTPHSILPAVKSDEDQFKMMEYFAALWSLCAMHTGTVINRPGVLEWNYERLFKDRLLAGEFVGEFRLSQVDDLLPVWNAARSETSCREIHTESAISFRRAIFAGIEEMRSLNQAQHDHYRSIIAESSRYIIHICVGDWHTTVLNEYDYPTDSENHLNYVKHIARVAASCGILFFAIVLTLVEDTPKIVRIDTNPQFAWYAGAVEEVNRHLFEVLQR
ncbi:hypothetical protein AB6A23_13050 [Paenibacillus tarimensis]